MLVPFTPQHLAMMTIQTGQAHEMVGLKEAEYAQQMGPAWSILRRDRVIASGGYMLINEHHAIGWAYLAQDAGSSMWEIIRMMRAALRVMPCERVDFLVHDEFPEAKRMAKCLKAEPVNSITVTSRDGQTRTYTVYSRGSGNGWH